VSIRMEGNINLYSYNFICSSPGHSDFGATGMSSSDTPTEVFILKKKNSEEFIEVRKRKKIFRSLILELIKDKPEILKEINIDESTIKDLIPIIQKYNSK
ncbi:MAG: hypothetical protein JKY30_09780, partial [Flavobacteriales bacterium]|nr:hypothetical protein [Flavobacteriales bacterium]